MSTMKYVSNGLLLMAVILVLSVSCKNGNKTDHIFGGSDFVLVFQKDANFALTAPENGEGGWSHLLMGEEIGRLKK